MSGGITKLSDYVSQHYEILTSTPIDQCDTFLIAETHQDEAMRKTNGLFISQFATPNSVLLVEARASQQELTADKALMQRKQLHIDSSQITRLIGWDLENLTERDTADKTALHIALNMIDRTPIPTCWKQGMLEIYEKCVVPVLKEGNGPGLEGLSAMKAAVERLGDALDAYYLDKIKPLQEEYNLIQQQLAKSENPSESFAAAIASSLAVLDLAKAKQDMELFIFDSVNTDHVFLERTQSMVNTLDKVRALFNIPAEGRVFLVAGHLHLKEDTHPDRHFKKAHFYSLQALRTYLESHPRTAVLKPRALKV